MISRSTALRAFGVVLALSLAPAGLAAQSYVSSDVDDRMENLEAKIEALRAEIAALQQELANARELQRLDGTVRNRGERVPRSTRLRTFRGDDSPPRIRERVELKRSFPGQAESDVRVWINGEEVDPKEGLGLSERVRALIGDAEVDLTDVEISGLEDHLRLFRREGRSDDRDRQIRRRSVTRWGEAPRAERGQQRRTRVVTPEGSTIWYEWRGREAKSRGCGDCEGGQKSSRSQQRRRTSPPKGTFFFSPQRLPSDQRIEFRLEAEFDSCEEEPAGADPFGRWIELQEIDGAVNVIQRLPLPTDGELERIEFQLPEKAPNQKAIKKNPNFL